VTLRSRARERTDLRRSRRGFRRESTGPRGHARDTSRRPRGFAGISWRQGTAPGAPEDGHAPRRRPRRSLRLWGLAGQILEGEIGESGLRRPDPSRGRRRASSGPAPNGAACRRRTRARAAGGDDPGARRGGPAAEARGGVTGSGRSCQPACPFGTNPRSWVPAPVLPLKKRMVGDRQDAELHRDRLGLVDVQGGPP